MPGIAIASFTFNPFAENTYVVYDDTNECIIIDPGCFDPGERLQLTGFIEENKLTPVRLVNTHCHIDHVLGNRYINERYELPLEAHRKEKSVLDAVPNYAASMGFTVKPSPPIEVFLEPGNSLKFGDTTMEIFFVPGHSPASLAFYQKEKKVLIAGDVLFEGSIGRTDLPGGDYDTLMNSIENELLVLPDETKVYPGHGPSTTIGHERRHNPFIKEWLSENS